MPTEQFDSRQLDGGCIGRMMQLQIAVTDCTSAGIMLKTRPLACPPQSMRFWTQPPRHHYLKPLFLIPRWTAPIPSTPRPPSCPVSLQGMPSAQGRYPNHCTAPYYSAPCFPPVEYGRQRTRNAFTHCDLFQQAEGAHIARMSRQLCLQLQPDLQQLCGCCDCCLHQAREGACIQY